MEEDNEYLVNEYLPSRNTKRFKNSFDILENHMNFITNESVKSRSTIKCELNIPYGKGPREKFDLYHSNSSNESSIFIYIHGGYWQELNKDQSAYCVRPLCESGYDVIILGYELCPYITLENLVKQIQKGIKYILEYAIKMNSKKVAISGHSAGAHLATFILDENFLKYTNGSDLIKNIYLISGVYNLEVLRFLNCINSNNILSLNDDTTKTLSPINSNFNHLKDFNIAIHIYVSENESKTYKNFSKEMYKLLKKHCKVVTFNSIMDCDHFDIVEKLSEINFVLTKFIISNL